MSCDCFRSAFTQNRYWKILENSYLISILEPTWFTYKHVVKSLNSANKNNLSRGLILGFFYNLIVQKKRKGEHSTTKPLSSLDGHSLCVCKYWFHRNLAYQKFPTLRVMFLYTVCLDSGGLFRTQRTLPPSFLTSLSGAVSN